MTVEAAEAIKELGVGVKCATITPDEARVKEFGLKKMWKSPNGTIRNILGGVIFREPIICKNVPRLVPGWTSRSSIGRHAYRRPVPRDRFPGARQGQAHHHASTARTAQVIEHEVFKTSRHAASRMAMYNLDDSIRDFARASLNYGLARQIPGLSLDQEHHPQGL